MIMADRFKSFFAIWNGKCWRVTTIDLATQHPMEIEISSHDEKEDAIKHLKCLTHQWNSSKRTNQRKEIV